MEELEQMLAKLEHERETLLDYIEQNMVKDTDLSGFRREKEHRESELIQKIEQLEQDMEQQKLEFEGRCQDYASLIKQIDPNFHHDNTFGADFSEIRSQFASNLEVMKKGFDS
jgi:DNA anti-recombination protein RmuC